MKLLTILLLPLIMGCSGSVTKFYLNNDDGVNFNCDRPIAIIESSGSAESKMVVDGMEFSSNTKSAPLLMDITKLYAVKELGN